MPPKSAKKPRKPQKPQKPWSMLPEQHRAVLLEVKDNKLSFRFQNLDDDKSIKSWDTSIHGIFACKNPECASKGWASKSIATTIRLYPDSRYNARIYHQRCIQCNTLSRPQVAVDVYAERVSYWLKKWSGVKVEKPKHGPRTKLPHEISLCEGCKVGRCKYSKQKAHEDDEED